MGMLIEIYTDNTDGLENYYNALKSADFSSGPLGALYGQIKNPFVDECSIVGTEALGKGVRYYITVKTDLGNEVTPGNVGKSAKTAINLALKNIKPIKALDSLGRNIDLDQFRNVA